MTVIVLQLKPRGRTRENPRARSIVADMERDEHAPRFARAHVHDQRLILEGIGRRRRLVGDDPSGERLSAVFGNRLQEGVSGCFRRGAARTDDKTDEKGAEQKGASESVVRGP
jgi:hypothetical protein